MMRDHRKDKKYFSDYIAFQKKCISAKCEKLSLCSPNDAEKRARIKLSLMDYRMNLLIAEFSNGTSERDLVPLLDQCCTTVCDYGKINYETALRLLSLGVLLSTKETLLALTKQFSSFIETDKILKCLSEYLNGDHLTLAGDILIPEVYSPLDQFFNAESVSERVDDLNHYLNVWYESCKGAAWYNSAESKYPVYYGYWSFESAALAKVFYLDNKYFRENEFFPIL